MPNYNRNLSTSIFAVLGFLMLLLLPFSAIFSWFGATPFNSAHLGDIFKNLVIIIYGALLIYRSGYVKISGITRLRPKFIGLFMISLYFLLIGPLWYCFFNYQFHDIAFLDVLLLLASTLSVGFSEEIIFRGFVLPHLIIGAPKHQALKHPLILASLLFGILHFFNLFDPESHLATIVAQVIYATFFGIAFGIVLLRSGSLIALGIIHGLINFSNSLEKLPGALKPNYMKDFVYEEALFSVLIVLPFLLFAWQKLDTLRKEDILLRY